VAAMPEIAKRNRQNQRRYGGGGFATKTARRLSM